eukprot:TRINITY_DN1713_c0_g2_i1.p1 TRINITY_DN1713_c0_g2~~TRINITY_DN1713_c0_g2_i1.p1  ORF type:complete len:1642 (+),score=538.02 TRINITY_DN1713_c0_g2_i1:92-5017(+)
MDPSSKRKGSKRKRNQTPSQDLQTTTRKKQKTQATVTSTEIQQENRSTNNNRGRKRKMDSEPKDQTVEKKQRRGSQEEVEAGKNNNQTPSRRSPRLSQSEEKVEPEKTEAVSDADQPEKMSTEEKPEDENSEDEGSISEDKRKETMESLLMKIGSPKDFNPIALSNSRLDTLLEGLKSGDDTLQLEALMELSDYLSIGTEESLAHFKVDQFAPPLVNLLTADYNPNAVLLAVRTVAHLLEALPQAAPTLVRHGAVPALVMRLTAPEWIDLAEQAIQAIEKLAENPSGTLALLRQGGLAALVALLDFFPSSVQRQAINAASLLCRAVTIDTWSSVEDALPSLAPLLDHHEPRVQERAVLCWSRLVDAFAADPVKLRRLSDSGLAHTLPRLLTLTPTQPPAGQASPIALAIKILAVLTRGCPALVENYIVEGLVPTVKQLLTNSEVMKNPQIVFDLLQLVNELLPPLPDAIAQLLITQLVLSRPRIHKKKKEGEKEQPVDARQEFYNASPAYLMTIGEFLLPPLVQVYSSTVNPTVKYKGLSAIAKIIHFSSADMLTTLLRDLSFSSFIASLLSSKDMPVVAMAIHISETLMRKLPDIFKKYFPREGVVDEIEKLITIADNNTNKMTLEELEEIVHKFEELSESSASVAVAETPPGSPSVSSSSIPPPRQNSGLIERMLRKSVEKTDSDSSDASEESEKEKPSTPLAEGETAPPKPALPKIPTFTRNEELNLWVSTHARQLLSTHFGDKEGVPDELNKLKVLVNKLHLSVQQSGDEEMIKQLILEIANLLVAGDGVSTFEFLRSNIINALYDLFITYALKDEVLRNKRVQAFAEAITTLKNSEGEGSFLILVRQLQNALNKEENFPSVSNVSTVPGASLKYLAQPFRFKVQKDSTDTTLQQYTHNAGLILVEPLATVTAVEDFLFSRIKPGAVQPNENEPEPEPEVEQPEEEENSGDDDDEEDDEEGDDDEEDDKSEEQNEETKDDKKEDAMEVEKTEEKKEEKSEVASEKDKDERPDMKKKKLKRSKLKKAKRKQAEKEKEEKEKNLLVEEGSVEDAEDVPEDEEPMSSEAVQDIPEEILDQPNVNNAHSTENEEPKRLQLSINGRPLPSNMTIFQALHLYSMDQSANADVQPAIRLWDQTFNIQYKLVDKDSKSQNSDTLEKIIWRGALNEHSPLDYVLNHPVKFSTNNETVSQILNLMRVLYAINGNLALLIGPKADELTIPRGEWLNGKVKGKILRLLQDPLLLCSRALPQWCTDLMHNCVFMVPHDVRGQFFKATSLGIARALMTVQDQLVQQASRILGAQAAAEQSRFGRIPRFKVRILRDKVLESAIRVMEMVKIPPNSKAILEVEYFNEKGTGLGPTLEFYTLVSRALQRSNLNMWLSTSVTKTREPAGHKSKEDEYEHVFNPNGLFPTPLQTRDEKVIELFEFMGTFIAKGVLDGRLLDLPLARPFYKVLLKQELTIDDLFLIAPEIGKTMKELAALCTAKREVLKKNMNEQDTAAALKQIKYKNASIEDMMLNFVLPGHDEFELKPNGSNELVTLANLEEYVERVTQVFLVDGVQHQFNAFVNGFNAILSVEHLRVFTVNELSTLLCGVDETANDMWNKNALLENTKLEHGYNHTGLFLSTLVGGWITLFLAS